MSKLKHLNLWTHPQNYMGTTWEEYYVFLSQTRDSDALHRSNYIKGLEAIGGEDNLHTQRCSCCLKNSR